MGGIVLAEGWPIKEIKELPWKYGNILNVKNSLYIKGDCLFSLSNGKDKTNKINRLLIWGEGINNLIIDTDENFYYALFDLSDELTKKIKNKRNINLFVENVYDKSVNHYIGVLSETVEKN